MRSTIYVGTDVPFVPWSPSSDQHTATESASRRCCSGAQGQLGAYPLPQRNLSLFSLVIKFLKPLSWSRCLASADAVCVQAWGSMKHPDDHRRPYESCSPITLCPRRVVLHPSGVHTSSSRVFELRFLCRWHLSTFSADALFGKSFRSFATIGLFFGCLAII